VGEGGGVWDGGGTGAGFESGGLLSWASRGNCTLLSGCGVAGLQIRQIVRAKVPIGRCSRLSEGDRHRLSRSV